MKRKRQNTEYRIQNTEYRSSKLSVAMSVASTLWTYTSTLRTISTCLLFFISLNTATAENQYIIKTNIETTISIYDATPLHLYHSGSAHNSYTLFYTEDDSDDDSDDDLYCLPINSYCSDLSIHKVEWEEVPFDESIYKGVCYDKNRKVNKRLTVSSAIPDSTLDNLEFCYGGDLQTGMSMLENKIYSDTVYKRNQWTTNCLDYEFVYNNPYKYDVIWYRHEIKKANGIASISGDNDKCIDNPNENVTFYFEDHVADLEGFYLQVMVYNESSESFDAINEITLDDDQTQKTLTYSELVNNSPEQYYGKPLYFRTKLEPMTPCPLLSCSKFVYSDVSASTTYYKAITGFSVASSRLFQACYPKIRLAVNVPNYIWNNQDEYAFNTKPMNMPEDSSNIAEMELVEVAGQYYLQYEEEEMENSLLFHDDAFYQTAYWHDIQLTNITDDSSKYCAKEDYFNVNESAIPEPLEIDRLSVTAYYCLINNEIYHYKKHGDSSSCFININLEENGAEGRFERLEYKSKGSGEDEDWQEVPEYQQSEHLLFILASGLPPNNEYLIRAVDTYGCTSDAKSTGYLRAPGEFKITKFEVTPPTCHPANTNNSIDTIGELDIEWSGGIGPYKLEFEYMDEDSNWQTLWEELNFTDSSLDSLVPLISPFNNYKITIHTYYAEVITQPFTMSFPKELKLTGIAHDLQCPDDNNTGSITYQVLGLEPGDTLRFSKDGYAQTVSKLTDSTWTTESILAEGTYNIRIETDKGCYDTAENLVISKPDLYSIQARTHRIKEYGDSTGVIEYDIHGANGGYIHYLMYNNDTLVSGNAQTTHYGYISSLAPGQYTLMFKDQHHCWSPDTILYIIQPVAPLDLLIDTVWHIDCHGNNNGRVAYYGTGGWAPYNYLVNGTLFTSDSLMHGLAPGQGSIMVIDDEGITRADSFTIHEPSPLSYTFTVHDLLCNGDSTGFVDFDISGGTPGYVVATDTNYWIHDDTLSGLSATDHQPLYVKDTNGCRADTFAVISEPPKLTIQLDSVKPSMCNQNKGAIYAHAQGGVSATNYAYAWYYTDSSTYTTHTTGYADSLYAGLYRAVVTDAHACTDTLLAAVPDSNGPKITGYAIDSASCHDASDGVIRITGVHDGFPGYQYFLDGAQTGLANANLSAGEHHFRVTDTEGCRYDTLFRVHQPAPLTITGSITHPLCYDAYNGHVSISMSGGNGGYRVAWNTGDTNTIIHGLNNGRYQVTVTDRKACTAENTFTIVPPPAPAIDFRPDSAILCTGSSKRLEGGDFMRYQWMKGDTAISTSSNITIDRTGEYVLHAWDSNGCFAADTFNLIVSDTPLDVLLFLQDSALTGEVVEAIDVTWPVPDSIRWVADEQVMKHDSNGWSYSFTSHSERNVRLTLRAWYGGCYSDSTKTVTFYHSDSLIPRKTLSSEPLIVGFRAFPNPNTGNFSIRVKLSRTAGITLKLYGLEHSGADGLLDVRKRNGLDEYEVPYDLKHLNQGMYILVLTAGNEQQTLKMIIE